MYAEIEKLINNILGDQSGYVTEVYDEHEGFVISGDTSKELIKDLLLSYYYQNVDQAFVLRALVQNCKIAALDAIELMGAVDELKIKNNSNNI